MQTAKDELEARIQTARKRIEDIEYAYLYERKTLQLTIDLATQYVKYGYAEACIYPGLNFKSEATADVSVPIIPRIRLEPVQTGRAIQDVWNIWSEAESVAGRVVYPKGGLK